MDQLIDTRNLAAVLATNPGLLVTQVDLAAIISGDIFSDAGCIKVLRYGKNSKDVEYVEFDSGKSLDSSAITNLSDFAQVFQDAANHGLRVTYCRYKAAKRISMVNLWPCGCTCRDGKHVTTG